MSRLTAKEKDAILAVLDERLAGGIDDLRDALSISEEEADAMWTCLISASLKLARSKR